MPIKFSCPYCSHSIKASSRHANRQASCPKCHEKLTIPAKQSAKRESAPTKAASEELSTASTETQSSTTKIIDETRIVDFEAKSASGSDAIPSPRNSVPIRIDPNACSIPRSILFLQGGLLAVLAILAFALGLFVGRLGNPSTESGPEGAEPVAITGKVEYSTQAGITTGDDLCIVCLLPALKYPSTKISVEGLRAGDSRPAESHPSFQQIKELGGDVAITDIHGNFELKLLKNQKKKRFYLLAVAGYTIRKRDIPTADRAQMGNYFAPGFSDHLLLDNKSNRREYVWKRLSVVGNDTENIEFH